MDLSPLFFADAAYEDLSGSLNFIFEALFKTVTGTSNSSFRFALNSAFSLSMIVYIFKSLRSGLGSLFMQAVFTAVLLTTSYSVVTNIDTFNTYVLNIVFDLPATIQDYLLSVNLPGFMDLGDQKLDSSLIYATVCRLVGKHTQELSLWKGDFNVIFYSITFQILVFIFYMVYWFIMFTYLFQATLLVMLGIFIFPMGAFPGTRQVFFEWIRSLFTILLLPVMACFVMFIVNNFAYPLVQDMKYMRSDFDIASVASGRFLFFVILGMYMLKKASDIAAMLTRGSSPGSGAGAVTGMLSSMFQRGSQSLSNLAKKGAWKAAKGTAKGIGKGAVAGGKAAWNKVRGANRNSLMINQPSGNNTQSSKSQNTQSTQSGSNANSYQSSNSTQTNNQNSQDNQHSVQQQSGGQSNINSGSNQQTNQNDFTQSQKSVSSGQSQESNQSSNTSNQNVNASSKQSNSNPQSHATNSKQAVTHKHATDQKNSFQKSESSNSQNFQTTSNNAPSQQPAGDNQSSSPNKMTGGYKNPLQKSSPAPAKPASGGTKKQPHDIKTIK